MILSYHQVAQLCLDAGFSQGQAAIAVAIAKAESNLNDQAIGDVQLETERWGPSVGLWQIRTLKDATGFPERNQTKLLFDDSAQAAAAFKISGKGTSFKPWSTFTSGAYLRFVVDAQNAIIDIQKGTVPVATTPPNKPIASFPFQSGYVIVMDDGSVYCFGCMYMGGLQWNGSEWIAVGTPGGH